MIATGSLQKAARIARQFRTSAAMLGIVIVAGVTTADVQAQQKDQSGAIRNDTKMNASVDGYADRLYKNGGSLDEWMKLVRYYGVLGKDKKALQALEHAEEDLKDNPQAIRRLKRFAKMVGLKR